jgi:hypothetical protein
MVRAYGDESCRLWAISVGDSIVEVANKERTVSITFPIEDVYKFDGPLFNQLKDDYESRSEVRLTSLWSSAERLAP